MDNKFARTMELRNEDKAQLDNTGQDLDRYLSSVDHALKGPMEAMADPEHTLYLVQQRLGKTQDSFTGRIVYSLGMLNWYLVLIADLKGVYPCCRSEPNSSSVLVSPIDSCVLPPDTPVLISIPRGSHCGRIITTLPTQMTDGNQNFSDAVVQGSNVGFYRDKYLTEYVGLLDDEGGAYNFCNSRPLDSLTGDWGYHMLTGLGLHLDKDMVYMRVSEVCGVFGYYESQTLRLAGYQTETVSATSWGQRGEDEGEGVSYHGETPYPWEMLGAYEYGSTVHRTNTAKDVVFDKAEALYEPLQVDQQPFLRYEEWGGYLGQGRQRVMSTLPRDYNSQGVYRYGGNDMPRTLFREHIGLDSAYSLVTAKSYLVAKRAVLPGVKRIKPADSYDEACDSRTNDNYRFAGRHGAGPAHQVGDPANSGDEPLLTTSMAILDGMVHELNWKTLHGFDYHAGDFKTQEESETGNVDFAVDFSALGTASRLPQPDGEEVRIDHRMLVKIYKALSLFQLTDDGSMNLVGGGGCELKFVGGQVIFSCPGDMLFMPGKSAITIAGDDIVQRARSSVDITAAQRDVRIKAERNWLALSAHGGTGAMLFESRSQGTDQDWPQEGGEAIAGNGILFKAPQSMFATAVSKIYLRTGSDDVLPGEIVLDAARGDRDVVLIGSNIRRYAKSSFMDALGTKLDTIDFVQYCDAGGTRFGKRGHFDGALTVNGAVTANGSFTSASGHFNSATGGQVGRLRDTQQARYNIEQQHEQVTERKQLAQEYYRESIVQQYYEQQKIGNRDVQKKLAFGYRTEADYNTAGGFSLPQPYWQQIAGGGTTTYGEPQVKYQDKNEFLPWPGYKPWAQEARFLTLPSGNLTMYDLAARRAKDRREPYEEAALPELAAKVAASEFKVISTP